MLTKTIKLATTLLFAAAFLVGCASTSKTEDTSGSTTPTEPSIVDTAPADPTPTPVEDVAADLAKVVYFEFDRSELLPESRALLTAHAAALRANPRSLRLEGHADERGTREYNIALGERRALAVRDFLRSEGVNTEIEVVSYGEERPASIGSSEASWQLNRRVELN